MYFNWESFIDAVNNSKPALGMDFVVELDKVDDDGVVYVRCYSKDDPDDVYHAKLKCDGSYKGHSIFSVEMDGSVAFVTGNAVWSILYSGF